ncbi:MAG: molecular chaperone HtpG [Bacteriovoracaceae bacterium]|nr:molecular chaperone HtpG [Bacteriovoracaceae bacterium]
MTLRKGTLSVQTNHILPIIKKWLYSEHDIFLRELIANATDAITKREVLSRSKNLEVPQGKITIEINKEEKTITVHDNGLGMTAEEVEKYIAQVAFSGAEEFVKKMQSAGIESKNDIIGKFGLGFYSCFMVANKVTVTTLSMQENSLGCEWSSDGGLEYEMQPTQKEHIGTSITLYLNDESQEFLEYHKIRSILNHYCDFMPHIIELKEKEKNEIINEVTPLWNKDATTLTDQDYLDFYRKLFPMDQDPLFWLHLNVDHPFELKGILFFPKLNPSKPMNEGQIRLYCKQVFVSDSVKNIIPDFLGLLKGAIDSSDIPLNVSRSALQGDPNVKKLSGYIIRKVAESLKKLFQNDRPKFEKIWEDIALFAKYGTISDVKFDELVRDFILFKNSDDKLLTLSEYNESIPENYKEKMKEQVIYFQKNEADVTLRKQLWLEKIPTLETDSYIDPHLMQHIEAHATGDKKITFVSIDSIFEKLLESENTQEQDIKIKDFFTNILKKNENKDAPLEIEVKHIKNSDSLAYLKVDEQMKRFQQMTRAMGQTTFSLPLKKTLVLNPTHPLIQNAYKIWEQGKRPELVEKICYHVKDLASLSSENFSGEQKESFVKRSQDIISELSAFAI